MTGASDDTPEPEGMEDVRAAVEAARLVPPAPGSARDGTGPLDLPLSRLARNDIGNAERFRARLGEDFRFLRKADWMVWDGHRWDREAGPDEASKGAQSVVIAIRNEANAMERQTPDWEASPREDGETDKEYFKRSEREHAERIDAMRRHANSSGNDGKLKGMLKVAAPHLTVTSKEIDARIWLFNAHETTIELRPPSEGKIDPRNRPWRSRPPSRDDLLTLRARAKLDPAFDEAYARGEGDDWIAAAAPEFLKFLGRVQPDGEMRAYLRRIAGYILSGATAEQEFFINTGEGANGKGTFYEALAWAIGDYAAALSVEAIRENENRNGSGPRPEIARLAGRRLVYVSEAKENERLAEGPIKKLTGQDTVEVRDLWAAVIEFEPQFKLVLYMNKLPAIQGTDEGIWRRIRLIDWPVVIPKGQRDGALREKLRGEADGILAWALMGFAEWREIGLKAPQHVEDATAEFRVERDPLARFVETMLVPIKGKTIAASELFKVYELWCERDARTPLSNTAFGRKLVGRRIENDAGDTGTIAKAKSGTVEYLDMDFAAGAVDDLRAWKHKTAPRRGDDPGPSSPDDYGAGP